jgi:hypothetical protein
MSEQSVKIENSKLKRRISELERELSDLHQNKPKVSESKIVQTAATATDSPKYDPFNPCPNDPVFNMLRQQHPHIRRRRSWLDVT